jgi:hypothetical protein
LCSRNSSVDDGDRVLVNVQSVELAAYHPTDFCSIVAGASDVASDRDDEVLVDLVDPPLERNGHGPQAIDDAYADSRFLAHLPNDGLLKTLARLYASAR